MSKPLQPLWTWKDLNLQLSESESDTLSIELHALFLKLEIKNIPSFRKNSYSKSLRFGFRDGSLDKNPKINKELKNVTVI